MKNCPDFVLSSKAPKSFEAEGLRAAVSELKDRAQKLNLDLKIKYIVKDRDSGVIVTVRDTMPETEEKPCYIHLIRNIFEAIMGIGPSFGSGARGTQVSQVRGA
jgi:hypothetical protein